MGPEWMPIIGYDFKVNFDAMSELTAKHNHGQSLDTLRRRGGLDPSEALALVEKRKWKPIPAVESVLLLRKLLTSKGLIQD